MPINIKGESSGHLKRQSIVIVYAYNDHPLIPMDLFEFKNKKFQYEFSIVMSHSSHKFNLN